MPTVSEVKEENIQASDPEPIIQLENLSVSYRLPSERIGTFKEYAIRKLQRKIKITKFWALTDISLQVNKGEVFGLIGNNGAGNSTML
jgi:ABC-type polysaccharide/polyol phosphate transport system ATPase subunit